MKKLFAILLAVAMIMSFALVASADEYETYTANLMYLDGDMDDFTTAGVVTTPITGPGTYTMTVDTSASATGAWGAIMLYVEIEDAYDVLKDWTVSDVKISVDGQPLEVAQNIAYVDPVADLGAATTPSNNIYVYHSTVEGAANNYVIELANFFAGFGVYHGCAFDFGGASHEEATWISEKDITVTFTLSDPNAVEETEATTAANGETTATSAADDSNAKTGDSISVFVALMAVSAMGIAVVAKKKH